MLKKFFFLIILCVLPLVTISAQSSFTVIQRQDLNMDDSFVGELEFTYAKPKGIVVAQIKPVQNHFLNDTRSWIRLSHYYATTRLSLPEIPFNYVIDRSGNIYEMLENSEGRVPYVDVEEGTILIGYFSDGADFTTPAQRAFKSLIEDYSYKFGIVQEFVQPVEVSLPEDAEQLATQKLAEGVFKQTFLDMIKNFEYFSEGNLRFSGEIVDLKYGEMVVSGETLKVDFTLKNTDSFSWYVGESSVFLTTANGEESPFAINQVWDSFSKPLALESQILLPGESVEMSFELGTDGVVPDNYSTDFKFVMLPDLEVVGTNFNVTFKLDKGERQVVQIRPTGTGALTVYECPNHSCTMVAAAVSGEKYLVLEQEDRWYKISVDGVEGWVIMNYATLVE